MNTIQSDHHPEGFHGYLEFVGEGPLSPEDQMTFVAEFHSLFDRNVANLSERQAARLETNLTLNPKSRVVPAMFTPSASTEDRASLLVLPENEVEDIPDFMLSRLSLIGPLKNGSYTLDRENKDPRENGWALLWMGHRVLNHSDRIYQKLSKDPKTMHDPEYRDYGIRYKLPSGMMVSREAYLESLILRGEAIEGDNGTVWTFPVLDISDIQYDRDYKDPTLQFEKLDTTIGPETVLAVQAMYLLAGMPIHPDVTHLANESISELNEAGEHVRTVQVVGVTRKEESVGAKTPLDPASSSDPRGFRLASWTPAPLPDWQFLKGQSGLEVPYRK